jgi:hypothetical protein
MLNKYVKDAPGTPGGANKQRYNENITPESGKSDSTNPFVTGENCNKMIQAQNPQPKASNGKAKARMIKR